MLVQSFDKPILRAAARGWKRCNLGIMGAVVSVRNGSPGIGHRPIVELSNCGRTTFLGEYDDYRQADEYRSACVAYLYRCFDRC